MSLEQKINTDLTNALKSKDVIALSVLRMIRAALVNKKVEKKFDRAEVLPDDEVLTVLKSEVKKRKDSIESYKEASRTDLADKENQEMELINQYLPEQLGEDQVKEIVQSVITEISPSGPADFGKVMGAVMAKTNGQADGQVVSAMVKQLLSQ